MACIIYIGGMACLQTELTIEWWSVQTAQRTPRLEGPAIPASGLKQEAESEGEKIILLLLGFLFCWFFFLGETTTAKQNKKRKKKPKPNKPESVKAPFSHSGFEGERYKFFRECVIKHWISTNEYYTMGKNMWKDTEGRWKKDNDSHRVKRKVGKV